MIARTRGWVEEGEARVNYYMDPGATRAQQAARVDPVWPGAAYPAEPLDSARWAYGVFTPDGTPVVYGEVDIYGPAGRAMAVAMCTAALGHEPDHGYVLDQMEQRPRLILAPNVEEARTRALQSDAGPTVADFKNGRARITRAAPHQMRAYYQGKMP